MHFFIWSLIFARVKYEVIHGVVWNYAFAIFSVEARDPCEKLHCHVESKMCFQLILMLARDFWIAVCAWVWQPCPKSCLVSSRNIMSASIYRLCTSVLVCLFVFAFTHVGIYFASKTQLCLRSWCFVPLAPTGMHPLGHHVGEGKEGSAHGPQPLLWSWECVPHTPRRCKLFFLTLLTWCWCGATAVIANTYKVSRVSKPTGGKTFDWWQGAKQYSMGQVEDTPKCSLEMNKSVATNCVSQKPHRV